MTLRFADGDVVHDVDIVDLRGGRRCASVIAGERADVRGQRRDGDSAAIDAGDRPLSTRASCALGEERHVFARGARRRLRFVDPLAHAGEEEAGTPAI